MIRVPLIHRENTKQIKRMTKSLHTRSGRDERFLFSWAKFTTYIFIFQF